MGSVAQKLHIGCRVLLCTYTCCKLTCTLTPCPLYHLHCITSSIKAFNLHTEPCMNIAVDRPLQKRHLTLLPKGGKCLTENCSDAIESINFKYLLITNALRWFFFFFSLHFSGCMGNSTTNACKKNRSVKVMLGDYTPDILHYTSNHFISSD